MTKKSLSSRQLGRFKIPAWEIIHNPDYAVAVFRLMGCVPVRAEQLYVEDAIEYAAISELFEEVPWGGKIPRYWIVVTRGETGEVERVQVSKMPEGLW